MSLFTQKKISEHVSRIRTPLGVCMYLVQGTEKSLLIDTGMGVGSLKTYLKTINVPFCDLVLTHGHCDHAGGAAAHAWGNDRGAFAAGSGVGGVWGVREDLGKSLP